MARKAAQHKPDTIQTVAVAAGVSTMTVSRVLRNTGNVAPKTRARVESAIAELGYVHNRLAGALAASHAAQISVIVPTLKSIVFTELLAGIAESLEGSDFQPVIGITEYDLQRESDLVKSMMGWRPAAFVLANSHHLDETVRMLQSAAVPVVEVMELTKKPIDICVGLNHFRAGKCMAEYLLGKGYRRFGYLGTNLDLDLAAAKRFAGFKSALSAGNGSLIQTLTVDKISGIDLGRHSMETLLSESKDLEAVYFSNDAVAVGAMMYCQTVGIRIPDDLALASFSGLDIAAAMPQPITTVRSPRFEMGRLAGERIKQALSGKKVKKVTDAGFSLIEGCSA